MTELWRALVLLVVLVSVAGGLAADASAASSCGASGGHTLCVTVPDGPVAGVVSVQVTNQTNKGVVIATWVPDGRAPIPLITDFAPSPSTGTYSFLWPTQKYLDGSGVLQVQAGSTSSTAITVPVTLANGNTSDFQHSPSDWASFLPSPFWDKASDPVVAAVGDGASDELASDALTDAIFGAGPDLLLYLGDVYDQGTFTEHLNHYGANAMDGGAGTLWGRFAPVTQPTIGNHEAKTNLAAWQDYFHGRPLYTSFRYGNVLFFDLASTVSMAAGKAQYNYVKQILTSTTNPPPPCIVSFWHSPAYVKSTIKSGRTAMWKLLTDNGGDLVLNGDNHVMAEYQPLNDQLQSPVEGQATMVELINGAGGHSLGATFTGDPLMSWSLGKRAGTVQLTLDGAALGGTPASMSWSFTATDGTVLHSGSRTCS
jgi:hypothetical protein